MAAIEAESNTKLQDDAARGGLIPVRSWIAAASESGNRWANSVLYRLKPRLSLLIGSLLVLLTMMCQGTVHHYGTPERGYSMFLDTDASWPGWLGWTFHDAGTGFYTLNLVLAAFTLFLLFADWRRPNLLRKPRVNRTLFLVAGSLALFFVSDCLQVLLAYGPWLTHTPPGELAVVILTGTTFALSWLGPALFWGKKGFLGWTVALATIIGPPFLLRYDVPQAWLEIWFTYPLIPLALWYRYRFSTCKEVRARWPRARNGIAALYIPAVLWDCVCMALFGFWGLLVYLAGITLISLGYMQLAREAHSTASTTRVLIH